MNNKILIGLAVLMLFVFAAGIGAAYLRPILIRSGNAAGDSDYLDPLAYISHKKRRTASSQTVTTPSQTTTVTPAAAPALFSDDFTTPYTIEESGSLSESKSSDWWLNSGAYFYSAGGVGSTVKGALSAINPWRIAYSLSNSFDTDGGYYPQNIFRLLSKSRWQNVNVHNYFKVVKDNLSASSNRNQSNGFLLMTRYLNADNLYYIGVRVDGTSVIKKKKNGEYFTLFQEQLPGIAGTWNKTSSPNLLPHNQWLGVRAEIVNVTATSVRIREYIDFGHTGNWTLIAEVVDDGTKWGGSALTSAANIGLRTDFMDVNFDDFKAITVNQ